MALYWPWKICRVALEIRSPKILRQFISGPKNAATIVYVRNEDNGMRGRRNHISLFSREMSFIQLFFYSLF